MQSWPPLHAVWQPRVGPGTIAAVILGVLGIGYAARVADALRWPALLAVSYVTSLAWMTSLALVDGRSGIGVILDYKFEYMDTARSVDSWSALSTMLHEYVARIDADHAQTLAVTRRRASTRARHVLHRLVRHRALDRAAGGLGGHRRRPRRQQLRCSRPCGCSRPRRPRGGWPRSSCSGRQRSGWRCRQMPCSATVSAWGLCCLAVAATRSSTVPMAVWSVASGLLLGYAVMMSYGLALMCLLAVAIMLVARRAGPLPWAAGAALAVVLGFAAAGFAWWEALPALHERQFRGSGGQPAAAVLPVGRPRRAGVERLVRCCSPAQRRFSRDAGRPGVGGCRRASRRRDTHGQHAGRRAVLMVLAPTCPGRAAARWSGSGCRSSRGSWSGQRSLPPRWRQLGLVMQVVDGAGRSSTSIHPDWCPKREASAQGAKGRTIPNSERVRSRRRSKPRGTSESRDSALTRSKVSSASAHICFHGFPGVATSSRRMRADQVVWLGREAGSPPTTATCGTGAG